MSDWDDYIKSHSLEFELLTKEVENALIGYDSKIVAMALSAMAAEVNANAIVEGWSPFGEDEKAIENCVKGFESALRAVLKAVRNR